MDNKLNKKDIIIKIILIIIIILLLIHNCNLLKNKNKELTPTGNVNIIEITCDKDNICVVDKEKTDDKKSTTNNNTNKKSNVRNDNDDSLPVNGEVTNEPEETGLLVRSEAINWEKTTQLDIFKSSMYELTDKIAPEFSNTYMFIIKNRTNYAVNYLINFIETNPYSINMKYKLKRNDTYLIDQYVSASELNQTNLMLDSNSNDTYYLEWKWISSDNDTDIGETADAKYELKIEVKAESTDD